MSAKALDIFASLTLSLILCYTFAMSEIAQNRNYKDSVFVDLFSTDEKAKERFLSLYNALHQTQLPLHCPVEQLKLDNTMYRGLINDVSCLIDNKIIVLAEHQSTINENMHVKECTSCTFFDYEFETESQTSLLPKTTAIRGGTEISFENRRSSFKELGKKVPQTYQVYVEDTFLPYDAEDARLFSKEPEFYVFYNGTENYPVNKTLKLSDAFITKPEHVPLELTVEVLNINKDKENQILKSCKILDEYSLFVEEVRIQKYLDPENGFTNAVKICIQKGILKEYLQRKSREVINMLILEYDYDTDIAVQRKESLLLGIQQGAYQKALETAKILKQLHCELSMIIQSTGLSQEEIEKL